jgi:HAMP domain-containing protein
VKNLTTFRNWIGRSVSRRLAIPGLILVLLLLVQAVLSSGSSVLLVGRLEAADANSRAGMELTQRLLQAAKELSDHARQTVDAPDETARDASAEAFDGAKARLGEVVDEISTKLSSDPQLQQAVSEGVSTFVVSGVKATRLAQRGRVADAQRELQNTFDPNLLAYVISTVTALNQTSSASLSGVLAAGQRDFSLALGVTFVVALIAAFAFWWAFRAIRGSVIEPVQYAALTARRLSTGDYAGVRESAKQDECGELMRAMGELCQQLLARRDAAEAAAADAVRAFRVRSGLDLASSRVLITDPVGLVIYANAAAGALMERIQPGRTIMGRSLDELLAAADANQSAVSGDCPATRLCYGPLIVDVVVCAIAGENGDVLGRVAEWVDRTEEVHAQQEVAAVVQAAGQGDFSQRIPAEGKSGYWGVACHLAAAGGPQPGRTHRPRGPPLPGPAGQGVRRPGGLARTALPDGVADPARFRGRVFGGLDHQRRQRDLVLPGGAAHRVHHRGRARHEGDHRGGAAQRRPRAAGG